METNNLTPDENLKNPPNYNPQEEPIKIYDRVEAPGIAFGDNFNDDELDENRAIIIILLFTALFLAIVGLLLYYL